MVAEENPSPLAARTAGGLWLVTVLTGLFAEVFVRGSLVVSNNPGTTAANIMHSETLFRLGMMADLICVMAMAGASLLLYRIFLGAGRSLALGQLSFGLGGCIILAANLPALAMPLILLGRLAPLGGMSTASLNLLALGAIKSYWFAYTVSLAFFVVQVGLMGLLILRSNLVPKLFGFLFLIEVVCNGVHVLALLIAPPFAAELEPYILLPGLPAEAGFSLWLLVMGVRPVRSTAQ